MFLKILQNPKKTPIPESLFNKVAGLKKETLAQTFSYTLQSKHSHEVIRVSYKNNVQ